MAKSQRSLIPGIILIVIGAFFLLDRLDIFYFRWYSFYPIVLLGVGALFFVSIFVKKEKGAAFPGTILLVLGLFFFLRNYGYFSIDYYFYDIEEYWPIFLIACGLGFIVLYFFKPADWGVLVPGGVLTFLGLIFVLRNFRIIGWRDFGDFWPVILIAVGLSIVINSLRKKPDKVPEPAENVEAP